MKGELDQIRERYLRRDHSDRYAALYSPLRPDQYMTEQEKERIFLSILSRFDWAAIKTMKVLDIGCGGGGNILQFLRWGFLPENIKGSELMPDHCAHARHRLPAAVEIIEGNALDLRLPEDSSISCWSRRCSRQSSTNCSALSSRRRYGPW